MRGRIFKEDDEIVEGIVNLEDSSEELIVIFDNEVIYWVVIIILY